MQRISLRFGEKPMTLQLIAEPAPLLADENGVIKVGGTRIPLATLVTAFH